MATVHHDQQSCNEEIYVVVGLEQSLLGRKACNDFTYQFCRIKGIEKKLPKEVSQTVYRTRLH